LVGTTKKIILKVYKKIKKYGIVSRTIYKIIGKNSNRKIESDASSEVITHIEIKKEISGLALVLWPFNIGISTP
jgi:hypothetical protein